MKHDTRADVMTFLNEVAADYPDAISLAAGRPTDAFAYRLNPASVAEAISTFTANTGYEASVLQYGRTAGMIRELVAAQLRSDDGVDAVVERLVVTAGCQEAILLCVQALCQQPGDVMLVCNPTYIGGTGAATTCGVPVVAMSASSGAIATSIERETCALAAAGKRARAVYLIPDFDNPTGHVISHDERMAVLEVCARQRVVVLEDNPYGQFRYEGSNVPAMAALDKAGCVIYLSTYSKTLAPAFRVGSALFPPTLFGDVAASRSLVKQVVQRKSFVTVNTSQLTQAAVGGLLLAQSGSLREWAKPMVAYYKKNREALLDQLRKTFAGVRGVSWNEPEGGFFLSLSLPFSMLADDVAICARDFGVIVMPMNFFALDDSHDRVVRLAFSAVNPESIRKAVSSFGEYVASREFAACA